MICLHLNWKTWNSGYQKRKKQAGKKAADLSGLSVQRIDHYMSVEELTAEFGENGWKQLPDTISRCYRFVPAKVEVEEHHIGVYASKTDEHMVKAPHPKNLLHGSLVSPTLAAAIINGKYVNAVPLYRLEKRIRAVWVGYYPAEHGQLDDTPGRKLSWGHV